MPTSEPTGRDKGHTGPEKSPSSWETYNDGFPQHNPIPMQDEQTQNYAALMSDVHKTFLRSGETLTTCFKDSMVVNYFF